MANKNILEVAFSKIQENKKTDLSTHEIELGSTDISDLRREALNTHNDAMKKIHKAQSEIKSSVQKGIQKLRTFEKDLDAKIKRNEKLADEIGIDIANTSVGKNMSKAKMEIDDLLKSMIREYNEINK